MLQTNNQKFGLSDYVANVSAIGHSAGPRQACSVGPAHNIHAETAFNSYMHSNYKVLVDH